MTGVLFDKTLTVLEKALDAGSLRQRVIAHNIANINTPGFKRSFVTFESQLKEALSNARDGEVTMLKGDPRHITGKTGLEQLEPRVVRDRTSSLRADGNNVDVDLEMTYLAMNTIKYNAVIQQLNDRLAKLRYVINEGRR